MSEYPSDWRECLLGDVVNKITSGGTPKADNPLFYGGDIPFLKIDDITASSKYLRSHKNTITELGLRESSAKIVPPGTLLLTMYGTIGECCITTYPVATNQAIACFLDHPGIELDYLYYCLRDKAREFSSASSQTTQANISATILKQTSIAVPPLPEQKKIAEILAGIDRSIAVNTNKINSLETLYTSLLADSLKKLPGNCLEMQLADACTEVFLGLTSKVDYVESEGIPLVRASNIKSGLIDFDSARHISHDQHLSLTKYRQAERGDVLVTKSGSLGECAIVNTEKEFSIYESIVCLKPRHGVVSTEYLFHAMQCNAVKDQFLSGKVGSAVAHLNLNDFRQITLPVPSLEEQKVISKALDSVQSSTENLRTDTEKKILLKNALSIDLLSGRKRVSV